MTAKFDAYDDKLDGALFRFWVRMASYPGGSPSSLAQAIKFCNQPHEYRAALLELAQSWRINIEEPVDHQVLIGMAIETAKQLRETLAELIGETTAAEFQTRFGIDEKRAQRIREIAGLSKNG